MDKLVLPEHYDLCVGQSPCRAVATEAEACMCGKIKWVGDVRTVKILVHCHINTRSLRVLLFVNK